MFSWLTTTTATNLQCVAFTEWMSMQHLFQHVQMSSISLTCLGGAIAPSHRISGPVTKTPFVIASLLAQYNAYPYQKHATAEAVALCTVWSAYPPLKDVQPTIIYLNDGTACFGVPAAVHAVRTVRFIGSTANDPCTQQPVQTTIAGCFKSLCSQKHSTRLRPAVRGD